MDIVAFLHAFIQYGYIGAFIVSFLGTASVFFTIPYHGIIFILGGILDPVLLIIASTTGATLGEFVSYFVGYGSRKILNKKYRRYLKLGEKWFNKSGAFTIFIFAATPLPDDVIGIIGGSLNYSKTKYFISCLLGKLIQATVIVYVGRFSFDAIVELAMKLLATA